MNGDDEYSKFTGSISKFMNRQWSKIRCPGQVRSTKNLDQLLEEEYETLLREIDYLASEQSCFLSYKNGHFFNNKSSEDLAELLNNHSEEVLKTYVTQNDKYCKKEMLKNRKDLVNYVTEIIVSRPKCDQKICSCRPAKPEKQVQENSVQVEKSKKVQIQDKSIQYEKSKKTQNNSMQHDSSERKRIDGKAKGKSASTQKHEDAGNTFKKQVDLKTKEVQTDDWGHDPNCSCGCCPNPPSRAETKSVWTQEKTFEDAATSYPKTVASKNVLANCIGDTVEAQTSHNKVCVPENFETILKNNETSYEFSKCTAKKDCGCDTYDVNEAIKMGLVFPSSNICIQTKKVTIKDQKSGKKTKKFDSATSADGNEISFETSSSEVELKQTSKQKKKQKDKERKKNKKKTSFTEESESSSSLQQQKVKPRKRGITKCFGTKKKRHCDEYCQGITGRQRSAQTIPIGTHDQNESADLYGETDKKAVQTGTNSEIGIQLSSPPSSDFTKKKERGMYISEEELEGPRGHTYQKMSKAERDQENKEKLNDSIPVCNKCGRQKRDCSTGCRNTIIIPYASGSNRAMPVGDAESLRMLIKMQNKDTSRQFDSIMAELNHQKGEIRRLNNMYQKMAETFYDPQRAVYNTKYHSPKMSELSHTCGCSNDSTNKNRETKACGCNFSNECNVVPSNPNIQTGRSIININNSNDTNAGGPPVRRFGPPNTAVSINMCDTCTVEIASSNNKKNSGTIRDNGYHEVDKQRKEQLNETKKAIQNITVRFDGGKGDFEVCKQDSVSTLYRNERRYNKHNIRSDVSKKDAHENLQSDEVHKDDSVSTIYKNDKQYKKHNDKPREKSNRDGYKKKKFTYAGKDESKDETLDDLSSLPRTRINKNIDNDNETDNDSNQKSRSTYSSRVLVWLKKSWISIKHKRDECRQKHEKTEPLFNVCQRSVARAASSVWKYMKKKKFFTAR